MNRLTPFIVGFLLLLLFSFILTNNRSCNTPTSGSGSGVGDTISHYNPLDYEFHELPLQQYSVFTRGEGNSIFIYQ